MNSFRGKKTAARAEINRRLLAVHAGIKRDYLPLAASLPPAEQPALDWAGKNLLPLLVLLPLADMPAAKAVKLAAAIELSYLAGRVHDLCSGGAALSGRAILLGDYFYALSAVRLHNAGYDGWLAKVGRTMSRRSEARLNRLAWAQRAYVPEEEQLANLPKEHAEAVSLAAKLAAEAAELNENAAAAYAEFGFYLGVLQGLLLYDHRHTEAFGQAWAQALAKARAAVAELPDLAALAEEMLLEPLLGEAAGKEGSDIGGAFAEKIAECSPPRGGQKMG